MDQANTKTGLVVGAHSADFTWRAGGAIALHARKDWQITVVCLTFGGEGRKPEALERSGNATRSRKSRKASGSGKAGAILGVHDMQFFNLGDYPMRTTVDDLERLADIYQALHPEWVLTHSLEDPYNFDHPEATRFAQEARIVAQAHGRKGAAAAIGGPPVFLGLTYSDSTEEAQRS